MEIDSELRRVLGEYFLFCPSPFDVVDYYLRRLIAGQPLPPAAEPLINRADVYACDPEVLAAQYDHVPQYGATGDRFFFTPCKRLKGRGNRSQRTVGNDGGSWCLQHNKPINDAAGVQVGEHKTLVHSKAGERTKWLMDEYRFFPFPQEAVVAGAEMVMCKIHFGKSEAEKGPSPVAADRPRAKKMRVAQSWTPPVATDRPRAKKMRLAQSLMYPDYSSAFTPPPPPAYAPPPFSLPMVPAAAEGDDGDQDRFVCAMDELLAIHAGEDLRAPNRLEDESGCIPENLFPVINDLQIKLPILIPADDKQADSQLLLPDLITNTESNETQMEDESVILSQNNWDLIQHQLSHNSFPLMKPNFAMEQPDQLEGDMEFTSYSARLH